MPRLHIKISLIKCAKTNCISDYCCLLFAARPVLLTCNFESKLLSAMAKA